MPTEIVVENGKLVVRGTDASEDLRPSVPEDWTPPKRKTKRPATPADRGMLDKLGNDARYELKQLRSNPLGSLTRLGQAVGILEAGPPVRTAQELVKRRAAEIRQRPKGRGNPGASLSLLPLVSSSATIARMAYSGAQKAAGAKRADSAAGPIGKAIDSSEDALYRLLGAKPPSQMTRAEREVDQLLADLRLNLGLIPRLARLAQVGKATTKAGKITRAGAAWGLTELASQYLTDNSGGGAVDLVNAIGQAAGLIPPGARGLPGGIGDKAGQLDMIDSANVTLLGNVLVPAGIGGTIGLAGKALPATVRRIKAGKAVERERGARAKLEEAGVIEQGEDGTASPGPNAQPLPVVTFRDANQAALDRIRGDQGGQGDNWQQAWELRQKEKEIQTLQAEAGGDGRSPDPWGGRPPVAMGEIRDPGAGVMQDPWAGPAPEAAPEAPGFPALPGAPTPLALPGAPTPRALPGAAGPQTINWQDADGLRALREAVRNQEDLDLIVALGEEGAKEFKRLDRARNSLDNRRADAASAEFDKRFGNLTPEQERLIYGNRSDTNPTVRDLDELLRAHSDVDTLDSDPGYLAVLAARSLDLEALTRIQQGLPSFADQAALIRMQGARRLFAEAGVPTSQIPEAMIRGLVDTGFASESQAAELVQNFMDAMQRVGAQAPEAAASAPTATRGAPGAPTPRALPPAEWDWDTPELTDVFKHVEDELTDEQRLQVLANPRPVMEQLQDFASTPPLPLDTTKRFDLAAFPTDRLSTLYLDGMSGVDGWSANIEALDPNILKSLAHPINSPELAERVLALTGKEAEEATKSDILEALRSLSREGRTALPERMRGGTMVPPDQIQVDPARFQFKGNVDAQGQQVGASLANEDRWNPRAEGVIQVWRDPADGLLYVVNGHNRLALAKRLGVPSVLVEEITATNAASARAFGAITNIAQGNGNAFDAARFFREAGITSPEQLATAGMSGERSWATQGLALSKLPQDLFQQTVDNPDLLRRAVLVGESGVDEPKMRALWRQVLDEKVPDWELKELTQLAKASPEMQGRQGALPGMENYLEDEGVRTRLRLVREVQRLLREEKNLFRTVGRKAKALEEAGNTIDQEGALTTAADADAALRAFETLKYATGPVGDALTAGVVRISQGQQPKAVARLVVEDMKGAIEAEMAALRRGNNAAPPPAAPGQADLFGAPSAMSPAERDAANIEIARRAMAEGGARPPSTPLPDLDPAPAVRPDEALADLRENGLKLGGKAAQAIADELRLRKASLLSDAMAEREALEALREAQGYDEMPFREKVEAGLGEEWDGRGAQDEGAMSDPAPGEGLAPPPQRPEPLRVSRGADQPEFTLPPDLAGAKPRYGGAELDFESDLDKAAYILAGDTPSSASKQAARYRDLLTAAGLNPAAVKAHGTAVKAAIKETGLRVFGTKKASEMRGRLRIAPVDARVFQAGDLSEQGRKGPEYQQLELAIEAAETMLSSFNEYLDRMQKEVKAVIRKIAGPGVKIELSDAYEETVTPREWGGDGIETSTIEGSYNYVRDVVTVNGMIEGSPIDLLETAYHESFHRLQFVALSKEELNLLESKNARVTIQMAAEELGYGDISYLEQQAVVFQKFAIAKRQNKNPVAEIFAEKRSPVVKRIIAAFAAILDYVERFKNAIKGKGFETVLSLYEKAYKGTIASRFEASAEASSSFLEKETGLLGEEYYYETDMLDRWNTANAIGEPLDMAKARIAEIETEIRQVRSDANAKGCRLP